MRHTQSLIFGVPRPTRLGTAGVAMLLISACGGGDSGGGTPVAPTPLPDAVTALSLSPANVALVAGETSTVTPTAVTGSAAVSVSYTYATSASGVATVSSGGVITAVAAGTATITVTANGSGTGFRASSRQATVSVTVTTPPPALLGVTVTPDSVALITGATASLTPTATTAGAGIAVQYSYASSAGTVASVSASGVVTAVSPGSATITVTAVGSGSGFTTTERQAAAIVTVTSADGPPAITSFSVSPDSVSLSIGDSAALAPAAVTADASVMVAYEFLSGASAVATVSASGVITAVSPGTTTITVTATGSGTGVSASSRTAMVAVNVVAPPPVLGFGFSDGQFAPIPAGSFVMGSLDGFPHERPVRTVTISQPFLLQKTEVTQAQWRQIMQGTGLENPSWHASCGENCPVDQVNWNDIQIFLERLNLQDPGKNYRLPTEAEWEYAARAGTTGEYGGNGVLNDMGWWAGNAGSVMRPVAQKLSNAWGLFDMHGNVDEWVEDCYTPYPSAPQTDPRRIDCASSAQRVLRGGSRISSGAEARSASRSFTVPTYRYAFFGFRVARNP